MKIKTGYITKHETERGTIVYNYLLPSELNLIAQITKDAKPDTEVKIKRTIYTSENDFITQKF